VKQSDLGEYEENVREKQNIKGKKHKLPLKPSHMHGNIKFQPQEGSSQDTRFLNAKDNTPLKPRRITSSPWSEEPKNPRFYQISLDKPQDKYRSQTIKQVKVHMT
jgi:hypothetical protein